MTTVTQKRPKKIYELLILHHLTFINYIADNPCILPPLDQNLVETNLTFPKFLAKKQRKPKAPPVTNKTAIKDYILQSEPAAKFYTGISKCNQEALWNLIGPAKTQLTIIGCKRKTISGKLRSMCIESQFLLTLLILRRDRAYTDISFQFGISRGLIAKVFKTWLNYFYFKFKDLRDRMFTKKKDIMKPLPKVFQNSILKETRVVIDATELPMESTANFKNQGNIYR